MLKHSASTVFSAVLLLGCVAASSAQEAPAQPSPESGVNPSARATTAEENQKSSATNDQSGPSAARPTADPNSQGEQATHSVSGRSGKEEPGSHAPTQDAPVLLNGRLNVPGAPLDSQTVPAKFSKNNDALDNLPIMALPILGLSQDQRRAIAASVKAANLAVQAVDSKPSDTLPWKIQVHDLGIAASDPALARVKVVMAQHRILLIDAPNRIVIGEIAN